MYMIYVYVFMYMIVIICGSSIVLLVRIRSGALLPLSFHLLLISRKLLFLSVLLL